MATLHRDRGLEGWGGKVIRRLSGFGWRFGEDEDEDSPEDEGEDEDEDEDDDGPEDEEAEGFGQVVRWL